MRPQRLQGGVQFQQKSIVVGGRGGTGNRYRIKIYRAPEIPDNISAAIRGECYGTVSDVGTSRRGVPFGNAPRLGVQRDNLKLEECKNREREKRGFHRF